MLLTEWKGILPKAPLYDTMEKCIWCVEIESTNARLLLDEIAADYGVFIGMIIQPTHRFDFNAPDALYHSVVKRRIRQYPFPLCQEHILRDYAKAVAEVSTDRVIQRSFWRAHRRDENGCR